MLKMKPDGGGRRNKEEIKQKVLQDYNSDLVAGFSEISEFSEAVRNSDWVASFLDARTAYYLHQDSEGVLQWKTEVVPEATGAENVIFVISMGMGYGSVFPQPSGRFNLYLNRTDHLISFRVTKENELWEQNQVKFSYRLRRRELAPPHVPLKLDAHITEESMATYGLGFVKIPKTRLTPGQPVEFTLKANNRQQSRRWFKLDINMFARVLLKAHLDDGIQAVCEGKNPRRERSANKKQVNKKQLCFGEIHTHSGEKHFGDGRGCGTGTVAENYKYARDISSLDFFALTDHDWQIEDKEDWQNWLEAADKFNEKGGFVTLPAIEWTSARYGHRNVYFARTPAPYVSCGPKNSLQKSQTPRELWDELRATDTEAITIPHHPQTGFFPVDWSYHDPEYERLVEIYSTWGNFETDKVSFPGWAADREPVAGAREAVERGYQLGFIASSDGHDGNAGNAQWSNRQPHIYHRLGSGRAVVWADSLSREDVFQALYERRCYATTGTRIYLDFKVNGNWMGSVVKVSSEECVNILAEIKGTADLERIEIVAEGEVIKNYSFKDKYKQEVVINYQDEPESVRDYYYIRVIQKDYERAWSSPCFVKEE